MGTRSFIFLLFNLAVNCLSFRCHAAESCLDETLIREVRQQVTIVTKDGDRFDRCASDTNTYKALRALIFLKTVRFSSDNFPHPFNQNILPVDFWSYFSARVHTVEEGDKYCEETGFTAYIDRKKPKRIFLCPPFFSHRQSFFEAIGTLIHEVRHFEGHDHVTCTQGPKKGGVGLCDASFNGKGSYAVEVEAYTKLALLSNAVTVGEKVDLKSMALIYVNEVFNKPVLPNAMSALVLQALDSAEIAFFDGNKIVRTKPLSPGKLISVSREMLKTSEFNAEAINIFSRDNPSIFTKEAIVQGYNEKSPEQKGKLVDVVVDQDYALLVNDKYMRGGLQEDEEYQQTDMPWKPVAVFLPQEIGKPATLKAVFIKNDRGQLFQVSFRNDKQPTIKEVDSRPVADLQAIAVLNGKRFALANSGDVLYFEGKSWLPVASLKGQKFKQMTREVYWTDFLWTD